MRDWLLDTWMSYLQLKNTSEQYMVFAAYNTTKMISISNMISGNNLLRWLLKLKLKGKLMRMEMNT